jgi:hypothetical protein
MLLTTLQLLHAVAFDFEHVLDGGGRRIILLLALLTRHDQAPVSATFQQLKANVTGRRVYVPIAAAEFL